MSPLNHALRGTAAAFVLLASLASAQTFYSPVTGKHYTLTPFAGDFAHVRQLAAMMGGKLVSIGSTAEQAFVSSAFAPVLAGESLYIGYSDDVVEGVFTWDDGTQSTYSNWNVGEPNNAGDEDAVAMLPPDFNYTWNDLPTSVVLRGIVEAAVIPVLAETTLFEERFTSPPTGWSLDMEWQIGPATPSTGETLGFADPPADADGVTGGGLAGVVIGGNAATMPHGYRYLTSPPINLAALPIVTLEFDRRLNSIAYPFMQNVVEVFDGANWQVVWQTGGFAGFYESNWTHVAMDLSPYAATNFRVRFGFSSLGLAGLVVSSWSVDNVRVISWSPRCTVGLYHPAGPGSFAVGNVGCTPGNVALNIFALGGGNAPNGWFFGLDVPLSDILLQAGLGLPPFVMPLDTDGAATFVMPGTVPPGITLGVVALDLSPLGLAVDWSPAITFTTS